MNFNDDFVIRLEDVRFHSPIGVFEEERKFGNDFRVDISITIDASSFEEETLETSISYADVFEVVETEMKKESLLLETVSKRIGSKILDRWENIKRLSVKITKLNPPIKNFKGNCSVEYLHT